MTFALITIWKSQCYLKWTGKPYTTNHTTASKYRLALTDRFIMALVRNAVVAVRSDGKKNPGDWSRVRILLGHQLTRGQKIPRPQLLLQVERGVEGQRNEREVAFVQLHRLVDDVIVVVDVVHVDVGALVQLERIHFVLQFQRNAHWLILLPSRKVRQPQ